MGWNRMKGERGSDEGYDGERGPHQVAERHDLHFAVVNMFHASA